MRHWETIRTMCATVGLGVIVGCGAVSATSQDDKSVTGQRTGRATAQPRAKSDLSKSSMSTELMTDYVSYTHVFRSAGMKQDDIDMVVSFVQGFGSGNTDIGNAESDFDHPGYETFTASCAECHNVPNVLGDTLNANVPLTESQDVFNKLGP